MWYICVNLQGSVYNGYSVQFSIDEFDDNDRASRLGGAVVIGPFPSKQAATDYVLHGIDSGA